MKVFTFLLIHALAVTLIQAQPLSIEDFDARFNEELAKIETAKREKNTQLRKKYLAALLRMESAAKQGGDLDGLQAARTEIRRVEQTPALTAGPPQGAADLRKLQQVVNSELAQYEREAADKISAMVESVERYAETTEFTLTREGDVEAALAWRTWRRDLRSRQDVAPALALSGRPAPADTAADSGPSEDAPALFRNQRQAKVITSPVTDFDASPRVFEAGCEPKGDEKRLRPTIPNAKGAGNGLLTTQVRLVEEDTTLRKWDTGYSDYKHKAHVFVARLQLTPLPNKNVGRSLVVFDLFRRGTGSKRSVIRTEGVVLPPMEFGTRLVVDSGSYKYETREYDSHWSSYDYEEATKDEFYGYVVTIFDESGEMIYQRSTERTLNDLARTTPPAKFDPPQRDEDAGGNL